MLPDKRVFVQPLQGGKAELLRKTNEDRPSLVHRTREELCITWPAARTMLVLLNARPPSSGNIQVGTGQMSSKNHVEFFSFEKKKNRISKYTVCNFRLHPQHQTSPQTSDPSKGLNPPHKPQSPRLAGALILSSWYSWQNSPGACVYSYNLNTLSFQSQNDELGACYH